MDLNERLWRLCHAADGGGGAGGAGGGTGGNGGGAAGGGNAGGAGGAGGGNGGGAGGGQADDPTDDPGDAGKTFTAEDMRAIRKEAAGYRTKLRETETRLKALEDAQLSDADKREKRLKELETTNADLLAQARAHVVEKAASKAGAIDPEDVAALIGADVAEKDLAKEIEALKKRKPYLFGRPGGGSADGGAGGGEPGAQDMNALLRRAAGRG